MSVIQRIDGHTSITILTVSGEEVVLEEDGIREINNAFNNLRGCPVSDMEKIKVDYDNLVRDHNKLIFEYNKLVLEFNNEGEEE